MAALPVSPVLEEGTVVERSLRRRALMRGRGRPCPWLRFLWAMARYDKFDNSSERDSGVFIFAGYCFEWRIEYQARIYAVPRRP